MNDDEFEKRMAQGILRDLERDRRRIEHRQKWHDELEPVIGDAQAWALICWMDVNDVIFAHLSKAPYDDD